MHTRFMNRRSAGAALLVAALLFLATPALAQTGPELLIKPWPEKGQISDGSVDSYLFEGGHATQPDSSLRLEEYDTVGRFRLIPGNEISPRIGYEFSFFNNHTGNPRIPDQLSDESIAFGTGIFKYNDWVAGITLGVGYAGDRAFGEGAGWYGKFDLIIARQINETDALGIVLDYDGHRNYLPDTPLPGFGYSHRFDPKLTAVIGLPYSSLDWTPLDHLDLKVEYNLYTDLKASAAYEFIKHWSAYGTYGYIRNAFEISDLGKDHRLLLYQRRAEVGIRFIPMDNLTFRVGVGYGWDGSYRTGFDFRKDKQVADISDEPYLHGNFEWKF